MPASPTTITLGQRLSYSVGHVLNNLAASMWFSYLLVYLQFVLHASFSLIIATTETTLEKSVIWLSHTTIQEGICKFFPVLECLCLKIIMHNGNIQNLVILLLEILFLARN